MNGKPHVTTCKLVFIYPIVTLFRPIVALFSKYESVEAVEQTRC